eukprot:TRINITY_DN21441_c0_g1_i1.p3 TRINITY_DN21441_c0_g1~~TRINITY_DN21441_c0_g1_i1.p3  ORF type:complete len:124 (+),score=42.59 TRINITY_DN21441_c0_g1_i1:444-815(+)
MAGVSPEHGTPISEVAPPLPPTVIPAEQAVVRRRRRRKARPAAAAAVSEAPQTAASGITEMFGKVKKAVDELQPSEKMALTGAACLLGAAAVYHLRTREKRRRKERTRDAEALALAYDRLFYD